MVHIPQKVRHRRRIPGGYPTRAADNTCIIIRRLSAKKPVWHSQEKILLHGTVKSDILDVSASLQTYLMRNLNLEASVKKPLLLHRKIQGYRTLDPTTKHQKYIPANLVLHIYRQTNTHLNTSIGQLIAGEFFFGMQSCEYSTTPKGDYKRTHILHKGDIRFYRKHR